MCTEKFAKYTFLTLTYLAIHDLYLFDKMTLRNKARWKL